MSREHQATAVPAAECAETLPDARELVERLRRGRTLALAFVEEQTSSSGPIR